MIYFPYHLPQALIDYSFISYLIRTLRWLYIATTLLPHNHQCRLRSLE